MQVLFGFGFVIFIHEMGHFLAAKRVGIKCPGFGIGFPLPWKTKDGWTGKNLFKYTWRGTEYRIGFIPFGGYVQMQGQADKPTDLGEVDSDDPGDYRNKTYWQKTQVLLAGVTMNAITAIIGFIIAFQVGVTFIEPTVGLVNKGSSAPKSGILVGDKIIEVNGREVVDFEDVIYAGLFDDGDSIDVKVERKVDGKVVIKNLTIQLDVEPRFEIKMPGIRAKHRVTLNDDEADNIVDYKGDIKPEANDEIVTVNGHEVQNYPEVIALVAASEGALTLGMRRGIGGNTEDYELSYQSRRQAISATSAFQLGFSLRPAPWIVEVLPNGAGAKAGLEKSDRIIGQIKDGKELMFDSFGDMAEALNTSAGSDVELLIERDGKKITVMVTPDLREGYKDRYQLGVITGLVDPDAEGAGKSTTELIKEMKIYGLRDGGVAEKAGLKIGDKLVGATIEGADVYNPSDGLISTVWSGVFGSSEEFGLSALALSLSKAAKGETVTFTIEREGTTKDVTLKPDLNGPDSSAFIGISSGEKRSAPVTYGFGESITQGFYHSKKVGYKIMMTFGGLFTGRIKIHHLGGPLVIAKRSYSLAEWGPGTLIFFLAFISINLAIVNMLPLPVLDGGQWLIVSIEAVMKKPLPEKISNWAQGLSTIAVLGLMAFVLANDALTIFWRKWV